ncbi:MAG: exo-alpha-sialidase, partial [Planctomycetota bacterium]
ESDQAKIKWQMLPKGDLGLRSPNGPIAEEHNLVALSDGTLYTMYRTVEGHPCHAYSTDGGKTWTPPAYATYTPGGRPMKNPRACPKIWKTGNDKFLFWYHNHSGKDYKNRNPAWISGGIEKEGHIHWSQPEILLYDPDPDIRISYPDLIEQDGRYWITETQKTVARVHQLDATLLEGLWRQGTVKSVAPKGLILSSDSTQLRTRSVKAPCFPNLYKSGSFTFDVWIKMQNPSAEQIILDSRDQGGKGIVIETTKAGTIQIVLNDGKTKAGWDCDRDLLKPNQLHHVVIMVDGGPKIITFVVDGLLCDGGKYRQYGWGRFGNDLQDVNGSNRISITPAFKGELKMLRIYGRYLRTSEAIGNYLAGHK